MTSKRSERPATSPGLSRRGRALTSGLALLPPRWTRKLLSTPAPPREKANGKPDKSKPSRSKAVDASKPAFQPRKVKKQTEGKYRDRASERREGKASDYAQAEALLQDFEKRTANEDKDVVEQQRRYLGGDSTHTVLVKGLDLSLLEANRAKESRNTDDDDLLEAAYRGEDVSPPAEASASPAPADEPKKRSRADIIKQMKEKRKGQATTEAPVAATALPPKEDKTIDKSKFKSIGFKPAGDKPKKKKAKTEGDGQRKKKKRKVEDGEGKTLAAGEASPPAAAESVPPPASTSVTPAPAPQPSKPKEPSPEPIPEDFDIFADAGDYEGIPDEEDASDREGAPPGSGSAEPGEVPAPERRGDGAEPNEMQGVESTTEPSIPRARWFNDDEPREPVLPPRPATPPALKVLKGKQKAAVPAAGVEDGEVQSDEETPARLAPLESSAVPSIKELLAMDEAREALEKRQKRKEKKKKGTGGAPPS
ncbi:RED-like protein N-terminal region-domain-containing protein [Schizophyllum commune]